MMTESTRPMGIERVGSGPRVQLSNFSIIPKKNKHWPSDKLRFTVTFAGDGAAVDDIRPVQLGISVDGCLMGVTRDGDLNWVPPLMARGRTYVSYVFVSKDLYDLVLGALEKVPEVQKLKRDFIRDDSSKLAAFLSPEFPSIIDVA